MKNDCMENIELKIINVMNEIYYGWVDKNNNKHKLDDNLFSDNYILQSPEDLLISKLGVCWDQVELERYLFENYGINVKTYFIVHYDGKACPTHTFLTYEKNNMVYWFEHSWEKFKGIHQYDSSKKLLTDVRNKFIKVELNNNYVRENLVIHEYIKPKFHISVEDFYKHCDSGKYVNINDE